MTTDFRETLYTIDKQGHRKWVYSGLIRGKFLIFRTLVVYLLMAFYLSMPWLVINGEQAIRLDIVHSRFVFFGTTFWATDTSFLIFILGGLAIAMFFFTALFGRVWCGWACPETVFLEFLYRPIERLFEGNPVQRLRLDRGPWNLNKIIRKGLKYTTFVIISWFIASTFLAYFVGRTPLINMMQGSPINNLTPFLFTVAIMGMMLFQFGWFREQFCTLVCPYARFQSVLLDQDSLTVWYDAKRGEPRKNVDNPNLKDGDCINCGLCVQVCPTGIDIRNGLQLECLSCAACIDACNYVMRKFNKPLNLIRYDTEHRLLGGKVALLRPRIIVYAVLLTICVVGLSYRLTHRELLDIQLLRGAIDVPFSEIADGKISNHLSLHVANKGETIRSIQVTIEGAQGVTALIPASPYPLAPQSIQTIPLFINFPAGILEKGKKAVQLKVTGDENLEKIINLTLLGPSK